MPNINTKTSSISMQNTIHKTDFMQSERRKREKIDNLRVPQPSQEFCASSTNTRTTTLCRGQNPNSQTNSHKGNE